jgi:hypothetical protein
MEKPNFIHWQSIKFVIEKDYLSGKYGAIPIVGDLTRLFNTREK